MFSFRHCLWSFVVFDRLEIVFNCSILRQKSLMMLLLVVIVVTVSGFATQVSCDFREVCLESEEWEISHQPELWPRTTV